MIGHGDRRATRAATSACTKSTSPDSAGRFPSAGRILWSSTPAGTPVGQGLCSFPSAAPSGWKPKAPTTRAIPVSEVDDQRIESAKRTETDRPRQEPLARKLSTIKEPPSGGKPSATNAGSPQDGVSTIRETAKGPLPKVYQLVPWPETFARL